MNIVTSPPSIVVSSDLLMTRRLVLRPLRRNDIDALHALLADPQVRRQLGLVRIPTWREAAAMAARSLAQRRTHGTGLWALVESLRSPGMVGFAGLWEFRDHAQAPHELVVAVAGEAPGGTLGQEAAQAIVDYARTILRWRCLYSSADPGLLRRLGFAECTGKAASRRTFRIDLDEARTPLPLPRAAGW
jgi:RimJ/RimL family protein N-acetyltransferase